MNTSLIVRGAREHNLKNVTVEMPRDSLVVITGLSGSGKSSLAFDTIYAEGQRRYVESLSAYARQFLEMMQKPDVDSIDGLSPAISIEQKTTSKNPRSTVGTVTEIYDYMRLLWARIGVPYSPATGKPIESQSASQMVERILTFPEGTRLHLLSPIVRGRKGEYKKEIAELRKKGFQRLKIDGEFYDIADAPALDKKFKHDIDVVVDRIVVRPDLGNRLADSVETALRLSEDGLLVTEDAGTGERTVFSEKFACPVSGFTISEIEPRLFSFNSPHGACPACDGLGLKMYFEESRVIPDPSKSLADGAIEPWSKSFAPFYMSALESVCKHYKASIHTPFRDLPEAVRRIILHGSGTDSITTTYESKRNTWTNRKPFEGVLPNLERRWRETDSNMVREDLARYQASAPCDSCAGKRLKPESLCVKIAGQTIADVTEMDIGAALAWVGALSDEGALSSQKRQIAEKILKEIKDRLSFLMNVGLDYLTLDRASSTLSGGESQRIRLASQIGSGLTGVLYVLDEPSIGLHQRDNERLLETLRRLRDLGNTVIVVEHDEDAIRCADHIIDMGPGAGTHGGHVVAQGTLEDILKSPDSLTAQYLTGAREIAVPTVRRTGKKGQNIDICEASGNNLKHLSSTIPIGTFTCITGVSGSGKSTLTIDTLFRAASKALMGSRESPLPVRAVRGLEFIDKVIDIDQSPIGRTPRSNPATYTGAFTPIREWFAGLPESKARGYGPGRFSFNVKGGRCETCQGDGVLKIEMHFLPDVYVTCEACNGKRYNRETLDVTWRGKSIADVLGMTVDDAAELFAAVPAIRDKMKTLQDVGLGYMQVGQQATTLSGGEAQRIKLSKELSRRSTGRTLYILDEPTTGLHFEDVRKLLEVLHKLVDGGNTVVVIEHNLDVIKTADWLLDIGPEGGHRGGYLVASGTPEDIAATKNSHTGHFLKPLLTRKRSPERQKSTSRAKSCA
ncbi:MAG: excinuclease ABC subunit UvrA [Rhodospirillales bacterium]|nr:excinuclease ABC subunit UvrA [Rhodospirillales bacterium]